MPEGNTEPSALRSNPPTPMTTRPASLFLIGYRCTGKTTVAQALASILGWDWLDADAVLEARFARDIRQIFAEEGEAGFRAKESTILEELCQRERLVLATGGGVVLHECNRLLMRSSGLCIWLTADSETIWQRLQHDPTTQQRRPNLTVGGRPEIDALLKEREPLYRACADHLETTENRTPEEIASSIKKWLAV